MISTAHIGVSYKCNMRCKHCFVQKKNRDDVFYMHYKEIIQKLYDQGLYLLFYTYGEPLCSEKFFEVADYVRSKEICQVLMTNGSLITDKIISKIKKSGINLVYVSIDSIDEAKHDANRGRSGAWEQAVKAIDLLVDNSINTGIACTVTAQNYKEISEIYRFGKDRGINNISFLRCRDNGKMVKFDDNDEYANQIKEIILSHDTLSLKIHDPLLLPIINDLYNQSLISEIEYSMYSAMCGCHKKNNINIAPNGDIYRCDFSIIPEGNIEDKDIALTDEKCTCI